MLGAPVLRDGSLRRITRERVEAGVELWREGLAPVVCMTGGGPPGRREADAMAAYARDLGMPDDALRVENESLTTEENASMSAAILHPEGRRRVWIVSQPFHLRRAAWLFARAGFEPLTWRIDDSLQDRDPRVAVRWIAREYGAWAWCMARSLIR